MKRALMLVMFAALLCVASPAQAASHHRGACSIRDHKTGKCLKAGRTCRFRSHGKWHTYYFCRRHKSQVVVIHDTTTVVQQQSCGACQPSPCENTCQSHEGDDSEHGDHGHEGHGHKEGHGGKDCD